MPFSPYSLGVSKMMAAFWSQSAGLAPSPAERVIREGMRDRWLQSAENAHAAQSRILERRSRPELSALCIAAGAGSRLETQVFGFATAEKERAAGAALACRADAAD